MFDGEGVYMFINWLFVMYVLLCHSTLNELLHIKFNQLISYTLNISLTLDWVGCLMAYLICHVHINFNQHLSLTVHTNLTN